MHGLNGHREKTWTFVDEKPKGKEFLWLKDFLPSKIPNARILTWGYDARTYSQSHGESVSIQQLYDHGRDLVGDLDRERRNDGTERRPIIFIAHSLGGLVVKTVRHTYPSSNRQSVSNRGIQALLHSHLASKDHLEQERSVKVSTYGIFFLGCPHQGAPDASTGALLNNLARIKGHTNNDLLKDLRAHEKSLTKQNAEFAAIRPDFDIKFGYETLPTVIWKAKPVFVRACKKRR